MRPSTPEVQLGAETVPLSLLPGASVTVQGERPTLDLAEKAFLEIPGFSGLSVDKPFSISSEVRLRQDHTSGVIASQIDPEEARGRVFGLNDGQPRISFGKRIGISIGRAGIGDQKMQPDQWHHITATYDGFRQRSGFTLYLDGQILPAKGFGKAIRMLRGSIQSEGPVLLGTRNKEGGKNAGHLNGAIRDLRIFNRALTESEVQLLALWSAVGSSGGKTVADLSEEEREALRMHYLVRLDAGYKDVARELQTLQDERRAILRRSAVTHVQQEKQDAEPTAQILFRGMYDQPRQQVSPSPPAMLPPMPDSSPAIGSAWPGG